MKTVARPRWRKRTEKTEIAATGVILPWMVPQPSPPGSPGVSLPRAARPLAVGVDTSSQRLAVSLPGAKTFVHDAIGSPDKRRIELYRAAEQCFSKLPAKSLIACEEPLSLSNGKTTRLLGLAAGAIWAAHLDCDVFWLWVDVSHWRKATVGNGNATKAMTRLWAEEHEDFAVEDLSSFLEYPDLWDAWCIRKYGEQYAREMKLA